MLLGDVVHNTVCAAYNAEPGATLAMAKAQAKRMMKNFNQRHIIKGVSSFGVNQTASDRSRRGLYISFEHIQRQLSAVTQLKVVPALMFQLACNRRSPPFSTAFVYRLRSDKLPIYPHLLGSTLGLLTTSELDSLQCIYTDKERRDRGCMGTIPKTVGSRSFKLCSQLALNGRSVCSLHAQQLQYPTAYNVHPCKSKPNTVIAGAVYALRAGNTAHVKIGHTRRLRTRIQELQVGHYNDLCFEFVFISDDYRKNEGLVHAHLTATGCHVKGEWFKLDDGCDYEAIFKAAGVDMSNGRVGDFGEDGQPMEIWCDPTTDKS
jgi:hypothetical protein